MLQSRPQSHVPAASHHRMRASWSLFCSARTIPSRLFFSFSFDSSLWLMRPRRRKEHAASPPPYALEASPSRPPCISLPLKHPLKEDGQVRKAGVQAKEELFPFSLRGAHSRPPLFETGTDAPSVSPLGKVFFSSRGDSNFSFVRSAFPLRLRSYISFLSFFVAAPSSVLDQI